LHGARRSGFHTSPDIFSPKGWDYSAQGNALGIRPTDCGSLKGCDNDAISMSQPFGLKK
jgi:hypothetical protein